MPTWAVWLLAAGAVLRLTRLVTADGITGRLRASWHNRFGGPRSELGAFITCPWCVSFWVAVPIVLAAALFGHTAWFWGPAMVLSLSWVAGLLGTGLTD
jgi:hypothetical protein